MKPLLLLNDAVHRKGFGGTFMDDQEGRAWISMEWDHERCPFAGTPPCLIVDDSPAWAWREGAQGDWQTIIVFEETRASWRAAWQIARLLANSLPQRPVNLDSSLAEAVVAILPGSRTRCSLVIARTIIRHDEVARYPEGFVE